MQVRILGSAAGGGSPQWNCGCSVCTAVRANDGSAIARTQSSIAIRGSSGGWFLVNASPDLRQQFEALPDSFRGGLRSTPFRGVILTDAEVDHTAGLLLMREGSKPLDVWCTDEVRESLTTDYPLLTMLGGFCGVTIHRLEIGTETALPDSDLVITPIAAGGDAPLYATRPASDSPAIGLILHDGSTATQVTYMPGLEAFTQAVDHTFATSDLVLVDGTFWTADELVSLGVGSRDSWAMGHVPLTGERSSLERLAALDARVILIHINNSNPVLLEDGPQRAELDRLGVELAHDGMEITVP